MKIKKTKNYNMFKHLDENRELNKTQFNNLLRSVTELNLLFAAPIIVDSRKYVLDGQHRLAVAEKLDTEIYYIELDTDKETSIKAVRLLNGSQKSWGLKDYISFFSKIGKEDYTTLEKFYQEYNISPTMAIYLLTKGKKAYKSGAGEQFKKGRFKVTDLEYATEVANHFIDYAKAIKGRFKMSRNFLYAVEQILAHPGYDHEVMVHKLNAYPERIKKQESVNDYLRVLENLYNYRSRQEVRFF